MSTECCLIYSCNTAEAMMALAFNDLLNFEYVEDSLRGVQTIYYLPLPLLQV